jgi:hypothetical protein
VVGISFSQVLLNSAETKVAWAVVGIKWFLQQFYAQVAKPLPSGSLSLVFSHLGGSSPPASGG